MEATEYKIWVTREACDFGGFELEAMQNVANSLLEAGWVVMGDLHITAKERFKQADDYETTRAMQQTITGDWTYELWTIEGVVMEGNGLAIPKGLTVQREPD